MLRFWARQPNRHLNLTRLGQYIVFPLPVLSVSTYRWLPPAAVTINNTLFCTFYTSEDMKTFQRYENEVPLKTATCSCQEIWSALASQLTYVTPGWRQRKGDANGRIPCTSPRWFKTHAVFFRHTVDYSEGAITWSQRGVLENAVSVNTRADEKQKKIALRNIYEFPFYFSPQSDKIM